MVICLPKNAMRFKNFAMIFATIMNSAKMNMLKTNCPKNFPAPSLRASPIAYNAKCVEKSEENSCNIEPKSTTTHFQSRIAIISR